MEETFETQNPRKKFAIGGILIIVAIIYLIVSATQVGSEFFYTVNELLENQDETKNISARVTGAVLGDTIVYDESTLTLTFTMVHMPADNDLLDDEGGLASALIAAVSDPTRTPLKVEYIGVKPDLLQHQAQAIVAGRLGEDGVFHAEELLLKCPTRYEEALPEQADA
jgi:cytochrome c-type biogenesis protein CcmE